MELAYQYTAQTVTGQPMKGVIFADNRDFAYIKLKRAGLKAQKLSLDPGASLSGLMSTRFNQRDLARFYGTIGKRINNGRPLLEGLMPAAEFVDDPRLKQAVLIIQQSVADGAPLSRAMTVAGFEVRDAMAIRAAEESGKTGDAFLSLSADVARRERLSSQLRSMFFMPRLMLAALYIAGFAAVWLLAPQLEKFMGAVNMGKDKQMDPMQAAYFAASHWVNDNLWLALPLWVLPVVALLWWIKGGHHEVVMDKIESWRLIAEKSDMASTWTAFGLLYDAGVPPYECARIVKSASRRMTGRTAWTQLERNFLAGMPVSLAIDKSDFPPYMVAAIKAADSSGASIPDEIRGICLALEEDVVLLTEKFKMVADIWIKITLAFCIFAAAQVTILPYLRLVITAA